MSRRHFIIAYDISNARRLAKVRGVVSDYSTMVQGSVYHARLTRKELEDVRRRLLALIKDGVDQVLFFDLGTVDESGEHEVTPVWIGRPWASAYEPWVVV